MRFRASKPKEFISTNGEYVVLYDQGAMGWTAWRKEGCELTRLGGSMVYGSAEGGFAECNRDRKKREGNTDESKAGKKKKRNPLWVP